jgi:hypothetical protein
MMRIKKIRFIDEVKDQLNDSIDVGIEFEDGSSYTIIVRTPDDLVEEMLQEGTNFIKPSTPVLIVKELTKKTVNVGALNLPSSLRIANASTPEHII